MKAPSAARSMCTFRFSAIPIGRARRGWRYDKARVGSWILEEPVHFFDLALWYLARSGRPVKVQALGAGQPGMQPMISVLMQFPDGATAAVNQILAGFEHHQTVEVVGDEGAVARDLVGCHRAQPRVRRPPCGSNALAPMTSRTCPSSAPARSTSSQSRLRPRSRRFRSGKPLVSAEEGRAAVAVCLAAEASANQGGRPIAVD